MSGVNLRLHHDHSWGLSQTSVYDFNLRRSSPLMLGLDEKDVTSPPRRVKTSCWLSDFPLKRSIRENRKIIHLFLSLVL